LLQPAKGRKSPIKNRKRIVRVTNTVSLTTDNRKKKAGKGSYRDAGSQSWSVASKGKEKS